MQLDSKSAHGVSNFFKKIMCSSLCRNLILLPILRFISQIVGVNETIYVCLISILTFAYNPKKEKFTFYVEVCDQGKCFL